MSLRMALLAGWLLAVTLGLAGSAAGQLLHGSGPLPAFPVASVRPSSPDEENHGSVQADGFFTTAMTVKQLIAYAYGMGYDGELAGGPRWMVTDRFAVEAKLDEAQVAALRGLSRGDREAQMRLMVQSLLAERFGLKARFENREQPVYELVIAKSGLKCAKDETTPPAIADPSRPRFRWSAAPAPPPPPPGTAPPSAEEARRAAQAMHVRTRGWPFWLVVAFLSHQPELEGRAVLDKTELDGSYDCEMTWSQEGSEGTGPSLFTAVRDELGLRLVPAKGLVEVLVVERVERPAAN